MGNAYGYLIGQFASESGKKAGEFYTSQQISELLTRLTLVNEDYTDGMTVYDIKTTQSIQLQTARKGDNTGVLGLVA
ncbi:hypothetical protein A8C46_02145 [Ligilactobacillus salivarius]|nr:hypothetical protein A8C38_03260 [Ligilactobacillus salivarius]PAY39200.1 hypothetical protein A8C39_03220 [Ligilactobacillus salivarius]PAY50102.1 hypothetical protein A8C42_04005 [Ligilactobacillus salivarius]PAY55450.1 hypothetical protein A8C41_11900 [Ligilactobacillus salivarius]PAY55958.1 hypothetical protein A8C46_02145 [Ligilactobacillus salivarius]